MAHDSHRHDPGGTGTRPAPAAAPVTVLAAALAGGALLAWWLAAEAWATSRALLARGAHGAHDLPDLVALPLMWIGAAVAAWYALTGLAGMVLRPAAHADATPAGDSPRPHASRPAAARLARAVGRFGAPALRRVALTGVTAGLSASLSLLPASALPAGPGGDNQDGDDPGTSESLPTPPLRESDLPGIPALPGFELAPHRSLIDVRVAPGTEGTEGAADGTGAATGTGTGSGTGTTEVTPPAPDTPARSPEAPDQAADEAPERAPSAPDADRPDTPTSGPTGGAQDRDGARTEDETHAPDGDRPDRPEENRAPAQSEAPEREQVPPPRTTDGPAPTSPGAEAASPTGPTGPAGEVPSERGAGSTYVVAPGDSLWQIAAEHADPGAGPADIAEAWPRWYDENRDAIGPDPDLVVPGVLLTVPAHTAPATTGGTR